MKKYLAILLLTLASCHGSASSGSTTVTINPNQVPTAVQGAFTSQHPYAEMTKPIQQSTVDNQKIYTIPYTRTDGSKGAATYTSFGELKSDQQ
jgi:hypothetical protein